MATSHTLEFALSHRVIFIDMSTLITALTAIFWIHNNHVTKLVIAIGIKPAPSSVLMTLFSPALAFTFVPGVSTVPLAEEDIFLIFKSSLFNV